MPYAVGIGRYADTVAGFAIDERDGFAKVLVDPETGLLLGCHVIGPEAALVLQPAAVALACGTTIDQLSREAFWLHPSLAEVLGRAVAALAEG